MYLSTVYFAESDHFSAIASHIYVTESFLNDNIWN